MHTLPDIHRLELRDTRGRERLRLVVNSLDVARLEYSLAMGTRKGEQDT